MKLKLEAREIFTKIVTKISTGGHVYLPKRLIGKKVFVVVPEGNGKWTKYGIPNSLVCPKCKKPLVTKRGLKIPQCKC